MKTYIPAILFTIATAFGCSSEIEFTPVAPPSATGNSDLLLSEISTAFNTDPAAPGSVTNGRNHYIEIYNGTPATVDLSDYAIGYQASTDLATLSPWDFPSNNYLILSGSLAANKCYVIASPQVSTTYVNYDITWGTTSTTNANASVPLQLSGNSAIALLKKDAAGTYALTTGTTTTNYKIIDVFGSPLVPRVTSTGSSSARNNLIWSIAGETDTRNRTFHRKATVTNPTTDWTKAKGTTAIDSEWQVSADKAWDYTNLGIPTK